MEMMFFLLFFFFPYYLMLYIQIMVIIISEIFYIQNLTFDCLNKGTIIYQERDTNSEVSTSVKKGQTNN